MKFKLKSLEVNVISNADNHGTGEVMLSIGNRCHGTVLCHFVIMSGFEFNWFTLVRLLTR